ncbi:glycosyltransferase family 2 protein, partial [Acidianus sp. RZ1]|uniref:glycosyltransferase family 2 protein n=1 Tax=Acidianus sp. RZ1 TaxID=1540082 RepID=UPI0014927CC0
KAGAVKTALDYVDTPYVAFLDADGTYPPSELNKLLVHAAKYDEVIGKRSYRNVSFVHRFGNVLINRLFSLIFAVDVGDVLSGMYILHTDVAKKLYLASKRFEIEIEIAAQIAKLGKITYVPISYEKRYGKRKLSTFKDGFKIISYLIKLASEYNPIFFYSMLISIFMIPGILMLGYTGIEYVIRGIFHSGYALIGIALLLIGVQGFFTLGLSSMVKRLEYELSRLKN